MKHRFHILCFIVLFGFTHKSKAQLFDSLQEIIKSKSSIAVKLESRYSFIDNELAAINGIRIGVAFRRKLRLGGGLSWLKSEISETEYITDAFNIQTSRKKYLKIGYICLYADFVFYKTKRWQLSVPIQTGFGLSWFQYDTKYNLKSEPKYFLFIYEPGISTQFKITKWLGLGFDVNYRFAIKNNKNIKDRFSSPTYAPKLLFWPDQLFFDLFPKSKIAQKKGPAMW